VDPEVAIRQTRRRALADEWALVLAAEGFHPSVDGERGGFALAVPGDEAERAKALLEAWEREGRERAAEAAAASVPEPSLDPRSGRHALFAALGLLLFFGVTGPVAENAWFARGSADAARIAAGEPWLAVTALTLHADAAHVLGNAVAGALFLAGVFRAFGVGVGALLALGAGTAGNLANAWIHRAGTHVSIGASTAVFGALGILAGRALVRGRARGARGRRAWTPVAAALALLAMIGTEGEHVDLWAHLLGLATGGVLGAGALLLGWDSPRRAVQWPAAAAAAAVLVGSWSLALGR
jgi:membrane associated rhomboid family serine protease